MIINASAVGMKSSRTYESMTQVTSEELIAHSKDVEKIEENLGKGKNANAAEDLKAAKQDLKNEKRAKNKEGDVAIAKKLLHQNPDAAAMGVKDPSQAKDPSKIKGPSECKNDGIKVDSEEDIKLNILKMMLKVLKGSKESGGRAAAPMKEESGIYSLKSGSISMGSMSLSASSSISMLVGVEGNVSGGSNGAAVWKRITAESAFFAETETTQFEASGLVRTADGREINFGINIEMSRGFSAKYNSFSSQEYVCTDPLVFNMGSLQASSLTDKKFLFDLNSDGKEESISFAANGSGFLALDKNGDGKINNGSELFGTKSGDGFKDLAAYDSDGNGWIDEADEVFKDLKIWTKDENGNDSLISLKEAGVGAIYLGSSDTQFSINNQATNATNGIIRKTGFFLKENGDVGTVQHVDLTT